MISKEEASIIAHEHIEGYILQDYCDEIRSSSSYFPIFWQFTIYHRDQDKNVFETIICISIYFSTHYYPPFSRFKSK